MLREITSNVFEDNVSVIFVENNTIKELNREFRQKDEETDVLSFEPAFDDMEFLKILNSEHQEQRKTSADIYICPSYIIASLKPHVDKLSDERFLEEIYRMIIHGILHLAGREHSTHLEYNRNSKDIEPMFEEQERLLNEFLISLASVEKK